MRSDGSCHCGAVRFSLASAVDTPLPVPPERTHLLLDSKVPWVVVRADPQDRLHEGFPEESIAEWHERLGLVSR